jgi:hypothetical protein
MDCLPQPQENTMIPLAAALAVSTMLLAGCTSSPTAASAQSRPVVESLTPNSGRIGTQVSISGSGFTTSGNTVAFTALALAPGAQMPNEPSVIPNPPSSGSVVVFSILPVWRPACSYSPSGPCPIGNFPTAPGTYGVVVTNANGASNSAILTVLPSS